MFELNKYVEGFLKTKQLSELILGIDDFNFTLKSESIKKSLPKINRLGKLVEFIFEELVTQDESFKLLCSNLQIINEKKTFGEIDYIFKKNDIIFHLEIAYKFYLFDESCSRLILDKWIGPNRKDSLSLKLSKLKNKQFPIINSQQFRNKKKELKINSPLHQMLLLKAQLFMPFGKNFELPNNYKKCIEGFWLSALDTHLLSNEAEYFMPEKKDWIIHPQENKRWVSKKTVLNEVVNHHERNLSPLIWMKSKKNNFQKFFIVWW